MDEVDEAMIRLVAIMAASMSSSRGISPKDVISRARVYEDYIRGEEE